MSTTIPSAALLDLTHLLLLQHTTILSVSANHPEHGYDVLHLQCYENVAFVAQDVLQDDFNVQTLAMASPGTQDFNN
jgi:hypothetical protein